ncbi:solute carrier organic anion transporter family member 1C1-like, partial [Rhincodon typus]|uniref:solute carrier organic anion transporter family member 1C1-like n=1 Tax=Rhincodon typus TaxID=259920 RepID=UPI00202EF9C8
MPECFFLIICSQAETESFNDYSSKTLPLIGLLTTAAVPCETDTAACVRNLHRRFSFTMETSLKGKVASKIEFPPANEKHSRLNNLKLFLAALSCLYFAKALSGSYMKSTITQIERRFDIPSSLIGVVDGSFEIGNLLVIVFVSYFGAKFHRPRLIAIGSVVMAIGTFLIASPHFFMGR